MAASEARHDSILCLSGFSSLPFNDQFSQQQPLGKEVVFLDFSKICQSCAKVWNCYGCNQKISYYEGCVPPAIQSLPRVHEDFAIIKYLFNFGKH